MKKLSVLLCLILGSLSVYAQEWHYTTSMHRVHWDAGMIVLDNNTVLMVGGLDPDVSAVEVCEIYNPNDATWSVTGDLNVARGYPCLVKLPNGHVLSISACE